MERSELETSCVGVTREEEVYTHLDEVKEVNE